MSCFEEVIGAGTGGSGSTFPHNFGDVEGGDPTTVSSARTEKLAGPNNPNPYQMTLTRQLLGCFATHHLLGWGGALNAPSR